MPALQTQNIDTTSRARGPEPQVEEWIIRLFGRGKPLGFQAGDSNLYRYAKNKPTTRIDPSGLSEIILEELPDGRNAVYYLPEFLGFNQTSQRVWVGTHDPLTEMVTRDQYQLPLAQVIREGHRWWGGTTNWAEFFAQNSVNANEDRQHAGLAWRLEVGHLNDFRNEVFQSADALEGLGLNVAGAIALPFAARILASPGLLHSFNRHCGQLLGRAVSQARDLPGWQALLQRVAQSSRWVPWRSGTTPTYATVARIKGQWILLQVAREGPRAGELVTAFVPNQRQLRSILNLMRGR